MKINHIPRILILALLLAGFQRPAISQDIVTADEFNRSGSEYGMLISTYREFFKNHLYDMALESWWILYNEHPDVSEKLYVDGVTMYRKFIEDATEGQAREGKIDTLMLIYDQRMAYFNGEGNILGRKGSDLLRYRNSDMEQVQEAYGMLKRSLEIEGTKSRAPVMQNFIQSGLMLHHASMIDASQAMEDYFMVSGFLDQLEGGSSRWKRTRTSIDEMILKEDILSCVGLDLHFGTRFDRDNEDKALLEQMIKYYSSAGCKQSDFYAAASEKLFEIDPGAESAHQLAMLFISRENLEKAAFYLQLAVQDDQLTIETRAEWFFELSIIKLASGDHCEAINFAREAIANKDDHGKAHMALGDAFIAARKQLGDDFNQRTAYWAATDMYRAAARVDPALAEESSEKLAICTAQYPDGEDIFFMDLKVGSSYKVGGCIQQSTTIRARE